MAQNGGIIGPVKCVSTPQTKINTFIESSTFKKTNCTSTVPEILVVAGGGGGGSSGGGGGGGGAGGHRTDTCVSMANSVAITVGAGGAGRNAPSSGVGNNERNSVCSSPDN